MKKENKIVKIINMIKTNKTTFFTIVGFVVVIAIFTIFAYTRFQMLNNTSSTKLTMATKYISNGQLEQGLAVIDDIILKYSRTPSSYRARLMKANYLITQKKYDDAEILVKTVIEQARPDTVKPLAYPVLIAIYDDTGKIEKAIATSQEFLSKYKTNFLTPSIMDNMARLYELSGNIDDAKKLYKEILDIYPNTNYALKAKNKLQ